MNERLNVTNFTLVNPTEASLPGDLYFEALTDMTIVGVSAAPSKDATSTYLVDIYDDDMETPVIADVDVSDQNVPGTWQAKGYGGSEDPVVIAKDSLVKIAIDSGSNGAAAGYAFSVMIWWLAGEDWK